MSDAALSREDNPRLVDRQTWWIQHAHYALSGSSVICTECAEPIPDAPFIGALVCEECLPYVPESERWL